MPWLRCHRLCVSSEGGSDADRDEKPAPRSAQSILASSASATVIAQEVKLRSRGELREGEWQARGTSESKDQFDDGVEKALEAVGMAAPDISQTERPRERSMPMSSLSHNIRFTRFCNCPSSAAWQMHR